MLENILKVLIVLFVISFSGYILSVLKEKIYLRNNMIVIDKKTVTQDHLDKTDIKEFIYSGDRIKSGDEIEVITKAQGKYKGFIIGIIKKEKAVLLVTYRDQIKKFDLDEIKELNVISKYGKFFK